MDFEPILILLIIFGSFFGIAYLYFSTRNKERLALIEKGADATIFVKGRTHAAPIWKVLILNIALLLMGIGAGTLIALIFETFGVNDDAIYPGCIFLMAGISLFAGFTLTKKLDQ